MNKNWRMGMNMQMTLWTTEENQVFFNTLVQSLVITRGCGLKLTRGILDMSALEMIMKGFSTSDYDWLLMEDLDAEYPQRAWLDMVWHLADMHNKLSRHSMFEVNYKILRAIENIILPLNAIFLNQEIGTQYLINDGRYHPLTRAILKYCDYCKLGTLSDTKEFSFIDYFMQAMLTQHGVRMCTFLQLCKENLCRVSLPPSSDENELVAAMSQLTLGS
ncbi:hypothetical protein IWW36_001820 [Coemansia brasiliensis]|uniref:Uncharacterized protein n=1 Tax=Coemansia brasiliensis TaxID=2650707 RepID=A0A9W8ID54_9FUNG|nr:hypothetical protein IWW36_001820 [Coemansia brasiliensis]